MENLFTIIIVHFSYSIIRLCMQTFYIIYIERIKNLLNVTFIKFYFYKKFSVFFKWICHVIVYLTVCIKNKIIFMHFCHACKLYLIPTVLVGHKEFWRQEVNSFPSKNGEEDGDKNFWMK